MKRRLFSHRWWRDLRAWVSLIALVLTVLVEVFLPFLMLNHYSKSRV